MRECVFSLSKCFRSNSCHPCPFPPPPPSGLPVFHAHRDPAPLPPVRAREEGWGPSTEAGLTLPRVTHRPFSNLYIMTMGSCLCPRPSGEGPESPPARPLAPLFVLPAVPAPSTAKAHGPHLLPFKREGRKHPWCLSVCLSHSHSLTLSHTHTQMDGICAGLLLQEGQDPAPSSPHSCK